MRVTVLAGAVLVGLLGSGGAGSGQTAGAGQAAKRDADNMSQAFLRGDLDTFAKYTHPAMVKMAGGKKGLIETLKKAMAQMKADGIQIIASSVEAPRTIVAAGDELQALLPQKQILDAREKNSEIHALGHLLGFSSDGGKSWTFLDASSVPVEQLRQIAPSLSPKLKVPPPQAPKIVPKAAGGSK